MSLRDNLRLARSVLLLSDFCFPRLVFNRDYQRAGILASIGRVLQTVKERPPPFDRRVIAFWTLIIIQMVTLNARFGVCQTDRFGFRERRILLWRRRLALRFRR